MERIETYTESRFKLNDFAYAKAYQLIDGTHTETGDRAFSLVNVTKTNDILFSNKLLTEISVNGEVSPNLEDLLDKLEGLNFKRGGTAPTYTKPEVDAFLLAKENKDVASGLLTQHAGNIDPHPQYRKNSVQVPWADVSKPTNLATTIQIATAKTEAQQYADGLVANKADLVGGKVPASQLPPAVDEILEFNTLPAFPATGATNFYYLALDTNKTYRWSGSLYTPINEGIALGETSATAYAGDKGKIAYDHSQIKTGNPHGTKASEITQDANNRFVTDAEKTTWSNKANTLHSHTIADVTGLQPALDGKADYIIGETKVINSATTDFNGWIKLDGRLVTALTPAQRTRATALGFTTNLPSAITSPICVLVGSNANYALPGNYTLDINRYNNIITSETSGGAGIWFNTTNYRFSPQRAGWYNITYSYDVYRGNVQTSIMLLKNSIQISNVSVFNGVTLSATRMVYMNGTTDFLEAYNNGAALVSRAQSTGFSLFQATYLPSLTDYVGNQFMYLGV